MIVLTVLSLNVLGRRRAGTRLDPRAKLGGRRG